MRHLFAISFAFRAAVDVSTATTTTSTALTPGKAAAKRNQRLKQTATNASDEEDTQQQQQEVCESSVEHLTSARLKPRELETWKPAFNSTEARLDSNHNCKDSRQADNSRSQGKPRCSGCCCFDLAHKAALESRLTCLDLHSAADVHISCVAGLRCARLAPRSPNCKEKRRTQTKIRVL